MNQESREHSNGVVCLFCRVCTRLPAGLRASEGWRRVVIVRCQACGKEAPYHASEIIDFEERPISAHSLAPLLSASQSPSDKNVIAANDRKVAINPSNVCAISED